MVISSVSISFYVVIGVRLFLACVLGGIIGYEREHMHKPAGLRTHTLVCVGSALVMVTSEYIFKRYSGLTNLDPARLGAQVISGIGFLGAGTIMREGFNIKGLTTAATLWVVACVGIAAGAGFYEGAIITTILICITLIVLKKLQESFSSRPQYRTLYIVSDDEPGQIGAIGCVFGKYKVQIKNIEFLSNESERQLTIGFTVKYPGDAGEIEIMEELHKLKGIKKVYEDQ